MNNQLHKMYKKLYLGQNNGVAKIGTTKNNVKDRIKKII